MREGIKTSPCHLKASDLLGARAADHQLKEAAGSVYLLYIRLSGRFVAAVYRSHELSESAASVKLSTADRQKHRGEEEGFYHPAGSSMLSEHQIHHGVPEATASCALGSPQSQNVSVCV